MAWPVSAAFLQSLAAGGRIKATATVTILGVDTVLGLSDLSVNLQDGNVRRTCSLSAVPDLTGGQRTDGLYDLLSTELAVVSVSAGFDWSGQVEMVPIFKGRATEVGSVQGAGLVSMSLADYGADLASIDCTPAVVQPGTMTRRAAIAALITFAFPDAVIVDTSTDTGMLDSEQVWSGKVWESINALATDGGIDVSAAPDGTWRLRDMPDVGVPVRLYRMGAAGTVKSMDRKRPLDKLYNRVVVTPAATDGSQDWDSVECDITTLDPESPRRAALAGPRVKAITSPTATATEAAAVAVKAMRGAMGKTERLSTSMFLDPSIDLHDTVQVVGQREADGGTVAVTHLIDGASFSILSGGKPAWSATLSTRNVGEDG